MTYETAKKLKDAGFTQRSGDHASDAKNCKAHGCMKGLPFGCHTAYIPNLSELVKACGDVFYDLKQEPIKAGWEATAFLSYTTHAQGKGNTPEEAVADLWLALNDKKPVDNLAL